MCKISRGQLAQLRSIFNYFDIDRDGKFSVGTPLLYYVMRADF
jgi:Ca2+-binding EF-hand superfamily protein